MIVLMILALLIEVGVLLGFLERLGPLVGVELKVSVLVMIHLVACALFAFGASAKKSDRGRTGRAILLVLFAAPIPLFGIGLAWWLDRAACQKGKRGVFDELKEYVKMDVRPGVMDGTDHETLLEKDRDTQPLIDLLYEDDRELTKGAIDRLAGRDDHHAVTMLRSFLSSDDDELRLQASAGLTRIEARLNERVFEAQERVQKQPTADAHVALAEACRYLCASRMVDEMTRMHYLKRATDEYTEALAINPQFLVASTGLAQIQVDLGNYEDALQTLQPALQRRPDDVELRMLLSSIYFQKGDYASVQTTLAECDRSGLEAGSAPMQLIDWWTRSNEPFLDGGES